MRKVSSRWVALTICVFMAGVDVGVAVIETGLGQLAVAGFMALVGALCLFFGWMISAPSQGTEANPAGAERAASTGEVKKKALP